MRFFLTFMISLQLVTSSIAAELGEKKSFSVSKHLYSTMAQVDARHFEQSLRKEIKRTHKEGFTYLKQTYNPRFKETKPGHWEYKAQGNIISFSSSDIYEGQILINDQVLKFRGVSHSDLEKMAEKLLVTKTTFMEKVFYNTFGIQEAKACELVCAAVIVVIVVAVIGTAVYELMVKPEKMVKRLNEMKAKLEKDANMCENAGNDQSKYMQTFDLANSIGNRSAIGSMNSTSEALEYSIKKQLESGNRNNEDCYQIMHEIGEKVDLEIPVPSQRPIISLLPLQASIPHCPAPLPRAVRFPPLAHPGPPPPRRPPDWPGRRRDWTRCPASGTRHIRSVPGRRSIPSTPSRAPAGRAPAGTGAGRARAGRRRWPTGGRRRRPSPPGRGRGRRGPD